MFAESARRAPMMSLQELYRVYTTIAAKPGEPVPLSEFRLSKEETEKVFSIFDEDYHISRFFHFREAGGEKYFIDGENVTHVAIDRRDFVDFVIALRSVSVVCVRVRNPGQASQGGRYASKRFEREKCY